MSWKFTDATEETLVTNIEDSHKVLGHAGTGISDERRWSFGTLWSWIKLKLAANHEEIKDILGTHKLSYIGLYQNTPEVLAVGPSNYASPSSNINVIPLSDTSNALLDFEYASSVQYKGTDTKIFECRMNLSYSNSVNNTVTSFYIAKNWSSGSPSTRDLLSVMNETTSSSSQRPNLSIVWIVELSTNDTIDLVVKADNSSNVTIQIAKYLIKEISGVQYLD